MFKDRNLTALSLQLHKYCKQLVRNVIADLKRKVEIIEGRILHTRWIVVRCRLGTLTTRNHEKYS